MEKNKKIYKRIISFFLVIITLFGLGGCSSSNNNSELTQYGVDISNLTSGIVLESKITREDDLTSVRLSTLNPKAYETYYLVYRFKAKSLEELKEDNKLLVHLSFDNSACQISSGIMIQKLENGETLKFNLFREEDDVNELISRVELPKEKGQSINVTISWKFFCDFDSVKYNLYFGSSQLDTEGNKLSISKVLTTRKATYDKPEISFDEETDSIIWDTVPNVHHYKIYIDGEVLGCDPEREDSYPHIGKQNESGKECLYLSTLKSLGVSGKVKVKLLMEPQISDLANPVYSNTITVTVK